MGHGKFRKSGPWSKPFGDQPRGLLAKASREARQGQQSAMGQKDTVRPMSLRETGWDSRFHDSGANLEFREVNGKEGAVFRRIWTQA